MPILLILKMGDNGILSHSDTLLTAGNVLDVALCSDASLMITMDHISNRWERISSHVDDSRPMFGCFKLASDTGKWEDVPSDPRVLAMHKAVQEEEDLKDIVDLSKLGDLLYGCENMRKRRNPEADAGSIPAVDEDLEMDQGALKVSAS